MLFSHKNEYNEICNLKYQNAVKLGYYVYYTLTNVFYFKNNNNKSGKYFYGFVCN